MTDRVRSEKQFEWSGFNRPKKQTTVVYFDAWCAVKNKHGFPNLFSHVKFAHSTKKQPKVWLCSANV